MSDDQPQFKWGTLLVECMKQLRAEGSSFVDQEVIVNFDGGPNGLFAWFICANRDERNAFQLQSATDELKKKMLAAGFSQYAIATLETGVVSLSEIDAVGGRFHYFR